MRFEMKCILTVCVAAFTVLAGMLVPAQGTLIANWSFNETSGTTVADSVGGNTGTLPTDTGATATLGVSGMFGTAISFPGKAADGTTDCVNVPMSTAFYGMSDLTISAWVDITSAVAQMGVVSIWNEAGGTNNPVYYLGMTKGGPVTTYWGAYAGTSSGVQNTVRSATADSIPHSSWHLVTQTFDGNWLASGGLDSLYIDGTYGVGATPVPSANDNRPYTINPPGTGQILKIGGGYAEFSGAICDVAIWNNLLTGETQSHGTSEGETAALFNVPMYNGHSGALSQYDASVMNQLFNLYATGNPATTLPITTSNGTLTWQYVASGLPGSSGSVGQLASGAYYVQLDLPGGTGGLETVVPEPGTLALLTAGLAALLTCAWRRRR